MIDLGRGLGTGVGEYAPSESDNDSPDGSKGGKSGADSPSMTGLKVLPSLDTDTRGTSVSISSMMTSGGGEPTLVGLIDRLLGGEAIERLSVSNEPLFSLGATDNLLLDAEDDFIMLCLLFSSSFRFAVGKYSPK